VSLAFCSARLRQAALAATAEEARNVSPIGFITIWKRKHQAAPEMPCGLQVLKASHGILAASRRNRQGMVMC
jgi:hypothetical protein